MRARAAAKALHAPRRRPLGLEFLLLDLLRVPNQFLPQMAHLVAGFAGAARRHVDRAKRDEIGQAARLRLFDVSECRLRGLVSRPGGQARGDQAFVDVQLIFEERDPERLRLQMVAQMLEAAGGLLERIEGPRRVALRLAHQAEHAVRLIGQHRRLRAGQFVERVAARLFGQRDVARLQRQPRQQEIAKRRLARQQMVLELPPGLLAEQGGAGVTLVAKQRERLVEIEEAEPHLVVLAREQAARAVEQRVRTAAVRAAAGGQRQDRHGLGGFVVHPELFELLQCLRGEFGGLVAQVQLQINLRSIEIAERAVVTDRPADRSARAPRGTAPAPACTRRAGNRGRRCCNRRAASAAACRAARRTRAPRDTPARRCRNR